MSSCDLCEQFRRALANPLNKGTQAQLLMEARAAHLAEHRIEAQITKYSGIAAEWTVVALDPTSTPDEVAEASRNVRDADNEVEALRARLRGAITTADKAWQRTPVTGRERP